MTNIAMLRSNLEGAALLVEMAVKEIDQDRLRAQVLEHDPDMHRLLAGVEKLKELDQMGRGDWAHHLSGASDRF